MAQNVLPELTLKLIKTLDRILHLGETWDLLVIDDVVLSPPTACAKARRCFSSSIAKTTYIFNIWDQNINRGNLPQGFEQKSVKLLESDIF